MMKCLSIGSAPSEIQTKRFQNTGLECYYYATLLGRGFFFPPSRQGIVVRLDLYEVSVDFLSPFRQMLSTVIRP
jgi:hypothetical protein